MPAPLTPLDSVSGALVQLELAHHRVHEAYAFTSHYEITATGATKMTAIGFITPAATLALIHMTVDAGADDECVLRIVEEPSVDLGEGTDLATFNRNRVDPVRNSRLATIEAVPDVNLLDSYTDVQAAGANITITAVNTLHYETIGQAGNPVSTFGGKSRGTREFVLKPEAQYMIILTRSTANATFCEITLNWYEALGLIPRT